MWAQAAEKVVLWDIAWFNFGVFFRFPRIDVSLESLTQLLPKGQVDFGV